MERVQNQKVDYIINESISSSFDNEELNYFKDEKVEGILRFQQTHSKYSKTPLVSLKGLAADLGVEELFVKDESHRFGLNAFKVMGGIYAMGKYLAERLGRDIHQLSFEELQMPEVKERLGDITFISATDGNHGRGVAWAARELGQSSVIYLPEGSSERRLEAIRKAGATAEITNLNYDETVEMCARLADENGWVLVQDTGWEGYEDIPLWIMQGYAGIAKEIVEEMEEKNAEPPTHIFLQAGVGSFAAGIAAYYLEKYREDAPKIIIVEPNLADCYYRSLSNVDGEMEIVTGSMNSIMAGLCCGIPNNQAYKILRQYAYAAFSCPDEIAALGMRVLGNPLQGDERIISGESGAVPLGLVYHLFKLENPQVAATIGLDENSRVLLINTEGDTDEAHYREVVWHGTYAKIKGASAW